MQSVEALPSIELRHDHVKGRSLHASTVAGIPAGTTLFQEQAFAKVVLSSCKGNVCAVCLRPSDPDICCDDCSQVSFCSEACQEALASVHELECDTLDGIDSIAKKSGADKDLLRLVIRILCRRMHAQPQNDQLVVTSYAEVDQMVHATSSLEPAWVASVERGAELLLKSLPSDVHVSVAEIVGLASRVNENSYSLETWTSEAKLAAVGMFPVSALMNHSCAPNCVWSNDGFGRMEVRTTVFVADGDELCFSYIDATQPRVARQVELLATKHFHCRCARCTDDSIDSMDAVLDGVCCGACLELLQPLNGSYPCCSRHLTKPDESAVAELTSLAAATLNNARTEFGKKQFAKARDLALACLNARTNDTTMALHPSHHILTQALQLVGDCDLKLGQYEACVTHRLEWIARLEKAVVPTSMARARAHRDVANALAASLAHNAWPNGTDIEAKKALAASHLHQSRRIATVCLPSGHSFHTAK